MKQIYNFEQHTPPVLNENILRVELEKRKEKQQVILLALANILFQIVLLLFGYVTFEAYPIITMISICYVVVSVAGSGMIAVVYAQKGGLKYE